jgi:2-dehydropantoate 2-reductase
MEDKKKKKIAVIGVGGRTGTMFAHELSNIADVIGIVKETGKKILIKRNGSTIPLNCQTVSDVDWSPSDFPPDIVFLTTKNPVGPIIKYYYQKCKDSNVFPDLVLSQNGIQAGQDAINVLNEVLGPDMTKIRIIRISLFNPIDRQEKEDSIEINYSSPIKTSFALIHGKGKFNDLFQEAGFRFVEFQHEDAKNMELSKLFFNLIGIPSASRGFSVEKGFEDKESFKEELGAMKEYVKSVKASGNNFVDILGYPVKLLTWLMIVLPFSTPLFIRKIFAKIISSGREKKPKDLSEINYYNGAVIDLGEKNGIPTPINKRVVERILIK